MIAKHVIQQEKGTKRENIKKVVDFLSEANNNLLSIEDILPFFPDFVLIDDFKVRQFQLGVFIGSNLFGFRLNQQILD